MSAFVKYLLFIAHGVAFTVHILTAIALNEAFPVSDPAQEMGVGGTYGILMCLGTILSGAGCVVYIANDKDERPLKMFIASLHAALLCGMAWAVYSYPYIHLTN